MSCFLKGVFPKSRKIEQLSWSLQFEEYPQLFVSIVRIRCSIFYKNIWSDSPIHVQAFATDRCSNLFKLLPSWVLYYATMRGGNLAMYMYCHWTQTDTYMQQADRPPGFDQSPNSIPSLTSHSRSARPYSVQPEGGNHHPPPSQSISAQKRIQLIHSAHCLYLTQYPIKDKR